MNQKSIITILLLSFIITGMILFRYLYSKHDERPLFDPFEINYHVTESSLLKNGYTGIPEDVPLLGKQHGDTLIYYQLDYECDESADGLSCQNTDVVHRFWVTPLDTIDIVAIEKLAQAYDARVISKLETMYGHVDSTGYAVQFFVKHNYTQEIFRCLIEKTVEKDHPYDLQVINDFPFDNPKD